MSLSTWGIVIASGKGEKFSPDIDTAFLNLVSKPILTYSLSAYEHCPEVEGIVIVAPKERLENVKVLVQMFGCNKVKKIVAGTAHRQSSVMNGLKALDEDVSIVSIHDASRPNITSAQISETIKMAKRYGCGVLAARMTECVKVVEKGATVTESLDDSNLWQVQTPQTFKIELIVKGYETAQKKKAVLLDDSQALTLIGKEVHIVPNERSMVKVAGPMDLQLAEFYLRH